MGELRTGNTLVACSNSGHAILLYPMENDSCSGWATRLLWWREWVGASYDVEHVHTYIKRDSCMLHRVSPISRWCHAREQILYKQNNQPEPLLGSCRHAAVYFKHVPKPFQGRGEDKKYTGTWAECADKGNHHQLNRGNWNYLVEGVESDESTTPVPRTISCQFFRARVAAATSDLIPLRGWFFMGFPCSNPAPIQISQHGCPAVAVLFAWLWRRKGGQRKRSVRTWMPCSCSCHRFHRAVRGQNWSFRRHWTFLAKSLPAVPHPYLSWSIP